MESSIFFSRKKMTGIVPIVICSKVKVKIAFTSLSSDKSVPKGPNILPKVLKNSTKARIVAWYFSGKRSTFNLTQKTLTQPKVAVCLHRDIRKAVIRKIWINTSFDTALKANIMPTHPQSAEDSRNPVFLFTYDLIKNPKYFATYLR